MPFWDIHFIFECNNKRVLSQTSQKDEVQAPNFIPFAILKATCNVLCKFRLNHLATQAYS